MCVCHSITLLYCRDERKAFILGKYEKRKFVIPTCSTDEDRKIDLRQAIVTHDLQGMLQVYAEGCNFMEPLPEQVSMIGKSGGRWMEWLGEGGKVGWRGWGKVGKWDGEAGGRWESGMERLGEGGKVGWRGWGKVEKWDGEAEGRWESGMERLGDSGMERLREGGKVGWRGWGIVGWRG